MAISVDVSPAQRKIATLRRLVDSGLVRGNSGAFVGMRTQWLGRISAFERRRFVQNSRGAGPDHWPPLAKSTLLARRGVRDARDKAAGAAASVRAAQKDLAAKTAAIRSSGKRKSDARRAATRARASRERLARAIERQTALRRSDKSSLARDTRRGGALTGISGVSVEILRNTGIMFNAMSIGQLGNIAGAIPLGVRYGFNVATGHPKARGITIGRLAALHNKGNPSRHLPRRRILAPPDEQTVRGMRADLHRAMSITIRQAGLGGRR